MPISLIILLALIVIAVLVGGTALVGMAQRREVLARAGGADEGQAPVAIALRPIKDRSQSRIREWLLESLPGSPTDDQMMQEKMVQAGYDSPTAPATFFLVRVAAFVVLPLAAFFIAPRNSFLVFAMWMAAAV